MFNKFTDRARKTIIYAKAEARRLNNDTIGTGHLLLGLIYENEGVAAAVLAKRGVELNAIREEVQKSVQPRKSTDVLADIPFDPPAKQVLQYSTEEARLLGVDYVGTEHILLALTRENDGLAYLILTKLGLDIKKLRNEVKDILGLGHVDDPIQDLQKRLDELEKRVKKLEDS